MSRFGGILAIVERVAGEAAASRLAIRAGGLEMKLSAHANSKLVQLVGQEAARALVEELGATKVVIPMAHLRGEKGRRMAATTLLAQGVPQTQVALTVDVHERTVRRILERQVKAEKDRQSDLFDRD